LGARARFLLASLLEGPLLFATRSLVRGFGVGTPARRIDATLRLRVACGIVVGLFHVLLVRAFASTFSPRRFVRAAGASCRTRFARCMPFLWPRFDRIEAVRCRDAPQAATDHRVLAPWFVGPSLRRGISRL